MSPVRPAPWVRLTLWVSFALTAGGLIGYAARRWREDSSASSAPLASATDSPTPFASAPPDAPRVPIGARIDTRSLEFVDSRYLPRSYADLGAWKAYAFVFSAVDCPVAQRYLPELADLERTYRDKGVRVLIVNVGAGDTLAAACAQVADAGIESQVVKDFDGSLVCALGVRRTPEVALLDASGALRYRGRIDDAQRYSGQQALAGRPYLREALDALLGDRPIEASATEVEGCVIERHDVAPDPTLTWSEHMRPLFAQHCATCHVRGGMAPFPLVEWGDVKRRAATIEEVVAEQRMPPWFARSEHGAVVDELLISPTQRDRIVAWLRAGAPEGVAAAEPESLPSATGWRIEPDVVLEGEHSIEVPASGRIPFLLVRVPFSVDEDIWVDGIDLRPRNPRVMHHGFLGAQAVDEPDLDMSTAAYLHMHVPGGSPLDLPPGLALRIPKGHFLWLQLHYVPNGTAVSDTISIALRFPREPIRKELFGTDLRQYKFEIPPEHPAHAVSGSRKFPWDITVYGAFPHMHARGRDMTLTAILPNGQVEPLLTVGNYSFDWQRSYRFEFGTKRFPRGTEIVALGRFDNSSFNPHNPDPKLAVHYGQAIEDEMHLCRVFYTRDRQRLALRVDPRTGKVIAER
jgi:mono/diheme cytochrome c family protein